MLAMIAILALSMDGGLLYLNRRRMQNAADAGALAGGRILALNGTSGQAYAAAYDYAVTRNRAATADIRVNSPSISVRACTPVQLTFSRVLGRLAKDGHIEVKGRNIKIKSLKTLRNYAD